MGDDTTVTPADGPTDLAGADGAVVAGKLLEEEDEAAQAEMAEYLYKLALLDQGMLKGSNLTAFIKKSQDLLNLKK